MVQFSGLPDRSIAVVMGTRPEIIKLASIVTLLGRTARVVHTGQHYDPSLSQTFFESFGLEPHVTFDIGGRSRGAQIAEAVSVLDAHFEEDRPRAVVVQGDTNTTMAAALAGNAREIPVIHVEAGLRSYDRAMPEEHNRVVTDHLCDLCLAPTDTASQNLRDEGILDDRIVLTGNTIVEAVERLLPSPGARRALLAKLELEPASFVLSTFHRPENVDRPDVLAAILMELGQLGVPVVLPLHPRSRARIEAFGLVDLLASFKVVEPTGYLDFLGLLAECAVAVTDSGGVQEEASVVKRPVLVVRNSTERPEVIGTFGRRVLPGPDIGLVANEWLRDVTSLHEKLAGIPCPFGDETAPTRSVQAIALLLAGATPAG